MPTTIKLKNSAGDLTVPASLEQGEVAINVVDGAFYYGGESSVKQNFTLGSATVTGNTVCKGTLVVTGKTTMADTLSATTSVKVGNGDGLVSAATVSAPVVTGTLSTQNQSNVTGLGTMRNLVIGQGGVTTVGLSVTAIASNETDLVSFKNNSGTGLLSVNAEDQVVIHRLENTIIGENTAAAGRFSTLNATGTLIVTGNTTLNGTLSATTHCKVGNGDGLISGETVNANAFVGTKHVLRSYAFYVNDNPMVQNNLYFGSSLGNTPSNWQDPFAVGGTITDTPIITIVEDDMNWGLVLPFDVSKVEVQCSLRPNLGTGDDFTIVMYTGIRSNNSNTDLTLTSVASGQTTFTTQRYVTNDITYTADLNAGTMIYVGVGSEDATDAKNARGIMNIVVTQR